MQWVALVWTAWGLQRCVPAAASSLISVDLSFVDASFLQQGLSPSLSRLDGHLACPGLSLPATDSDAVVAVVAEEAGR